MEDTTELGRDDILLDVKMLGGGRGEREEWVERWQERVVMVDHRVE